jgi:hypothetical protein
VLLLDVELVEVATEDAAEDEGEDGGEDEVEGEVEDETAFAASTTPPSTAAGVVLPCADLAPVKNSSRVFPDDLSKTLALLSCPIFSE